MWNTERAMDTLLSTCLSVYRPAVASSRLPKKKHPWMQNAAISRPISQRHMDPAATGLTSIAIDEDLTLAPRPRRRGIVTAILIPLPVRQHVADPRAIRQPVNLLKILLANLKRLGRHVGNVLPDQLARIDRRPIDLLQQERPEGFYAGAQKGAVEGDVDAFEGDGGEAALELDRLGFRRGLGGAFADDVDEAGFHVVQGEGFDEGVDVDFLGF